MRYAGGERRDDDLVVVVALQRARDRRERIVVADQAGDMASGRILEQRDRQLERDRRLLRVGVPIRARDEQREAARAL
jgi:hypothetical protein